jgi:MFS family permease
VTAAPRAPVRSPVGQGGSHLGDGAALVALVVYVQQTQGRGVAVSALLLAGTVPTLLGPLAGALVDRVEQRRLMLGAQAGQALLYGAMAALPPPFPVLLVLVAAASLLATVFAPAGQSVVPSLVPPTDLVRANSWMGMALTFQGTIGPAVGGFVVAVRASAGALWGKCPELRDLGRAGGWPAPLALQGADGQRVGLLKGTWEGLRYALGHPVARALVIGLGFGVLFAAVDDVALVFLAREDLHAGAVGYGVLVSVYGIGFALGPWPCCGPAPPPAWPSSSSDSCSAAPAGCSPGWRPSLAWPLAQAVAGSGNGLEVVATDTLVQRSVPRSHRGRVFGVVSAATLLGGAIARGLGGVLVDLTSARATFVIGGSGVLLVTLVAVVLFRGVGRGPVDA